MTVPTTPGTLSRARTPIAAMIRRIAVIGALALTVFGLSVPVASAGESPGPTVTVRTRHR